MPVRMLLKLRLFLKSPLKNFLRFIQRSTSSHSMALSSPTLDLVMVFPIRGIPVLSYFASLRSLVLGADDPSIELWKYQIVALYHVKDTGPFSEHESIYAELRVVGDPDARMFKFLRFERTRCVYTALDDFASLETKTVKVESLKAPGKAVEGEAEMNSQPWLQRYYGMFCAALGEVSLDNLSLASTASLASSLESSTSDIAEDLVTGAKELPSSPHHRVISKHSIPDPGQLSLLQLALMATTVHSSDRMYTLLKRQCYWYSAMLATLVSREAGCILEPEPPLEPGSVDEDQVCLTYHGSLAGRWKTIKISEIKETMAIQIRSQYDMEWMTVFEEVSSGCYC